MSKPEQARASTSKEEFTMRVEVNWDACESNALCMAAAPEVFEVRDDDFLYLLIEGEIPEALRSKVEEAVRVCPKQALTLVED
jgi:ferredoxin